MSMADYYLPDTGVQVKQNKIKQNQQSKKLLLGIDLETTGTDASQDSIIEIGAVLWDVEAKKPLTMISEFIITDAEISQEITELTGITNKDCMDYGIPLHDGLLKLDNLSCKAKHKVAYNVDFEDSFLSIYPSCLANFNLIKWIDPQYDIPYPKHIKTRKLEYLCFEHGFKNPFKHRALFDVLAMFEIMSQYDINIIVERAQSPKIRVAALVSYENRLLAKNHGFWWDGDLRYWIKEIKELDFELLKQSVPFELMNLSQATSYDEDGDLEMPF